MKNTRQFKIKFILISIFTLSSGAEILSAATSGSSASMSQAAQTPSAAANQIVQMVVRDYAVKDVARLAIDRALENIQGNTQNRKLFLSSLLQGISNSVENRNLVFQIATKHYGLTHAEFIEGMKGMPKNQRFEEPQDLGS